MFSVTRFCNLIMLLVLCPVVASGDVIIDNFSTTVANAAVSSVSSPFGSIEIEQDGTASIMGINNVGYLVEIPHSEGSASLTYEFTSGFSSLFSTASKSSFTKIFVPVYTEDSWSLRVSLIDGAGETFIHGDAAAGSTIFGTSTDPLEISLDRTMNELAGGNDISQIKFKFEYTGGIAPLDTHRLHFGGTAGDFSGAIFGAVPEPASIFMFGPIAVGLIIRRRRK